MQDLHKQEKKWMNHVLKKCMLGDPEDIKEFTKELSKVIDKKDVDELYKQSYEHDKSMDSTLYDLLNTEEEVLMLEYKYGVKMNHGEILKTLLAHNSEYKKMYREFLEFYLK